ncbi:MULTISPECIES: acylphosphatase [Haloarcula]|nr:MULTISPECIES: acylphosphatase [Haloarcula]QCP90875.1 acylphosphatase [Haloarcula marismortui ATCC 43049]
MAEGDSITKAAGKSSDMAHTRAHVFVSGRVQGVYYRATTRERAQDQGVNGWVRNLDDGRVEAVFEGPDADVEAMVEFCHEGSERANVTDVEVEYEDPEGVDGFEVRW